jgi:hypothetical protein
LRFKETICNLRAMGLAPLLDLGSPMCASIQLGLHKFGALDFISNTNLVRVCTQTGSGFPEAFVNLAGFVNESRANALNVV